MSFYILKGTQNMNKNMESNVLTNDTEVINNNCDSEDGTSDRNEQQQNDNNSNDLARLENMTKGSANKTHAENSQNASSNQSSLNNRRSQKKRKRHYNINKNKKWSKSYKRQKSINVTKLDAENVSQNNRNKHLYAKVPKITFNNKQVMHRGGGLSKFFLPDKRPRKDIIVPPTKFLLGGNISDPLNLNSLQDEALVSMSAVTPKSSPITTPPKVEVIIPPNIYDPLHLLDPVDSIEYEKQLVSPDKNRRSNKQRSKKKKIRKSNADVSNSVKKIEVQEHIHTGANLNSSPTSNDFRDIPETFGNQGQEISGNLTIPEDKFKVNKDLHFDVNAVDSFSRKRKNSESCQSIVNIPGIGSGNTNKKIRRFDSKNKIVSPVIPQPGAWKRPPKVLLGAPRNRIRTSSTSGKLVKHKAIRFFENISIFHLKLSPFCIDVDNEEANVKKSDPSPSENLKTVDLSVKLHNEERPPEQFAPSYTSDTTSIFGGTQSNSCKTSLSQESSKYQFGNYAGQYSGLKNIYNFSDVRLTVFMRHAYLFKDKDILDIGCNVGHMTIAVARSLQPKSIVGIDVDKDLIARARRNLSFFQRIPQKDLKTLHFRWKTKTGENKIFCSSSEREKLSYKSKMYSRAKDREKHDQNQADFFPLTFPICFGSIPDIRYKAESPSSSPASSTQKQDHLENVQPSSSDATPPKTGDRAENSEWNGMENMFPHNVLFRTFDYAVTEESQMVKDKQQYDLILCLSLTKWIHLNFGDSGLKMTFRRMFNQLRPGGKLILEAQNWASYKNRKKLTVSLFGEIDN